jgi:hypothetical protein
MVANAIANTPWLCGRLCNRIPSAQSLILVLKPDLILIVNTRQDRRPLTEAQICTTADCTFVRPACKKTLVECSCVKLSRRLTLVQQANL